MTEKNQKHNSSINQIAREYGPLVSAICRKMIRDEESARDAAQEVWVEIIKSLPSFKGQAKISTWIYAVTSRVCLRFAKSERIYTTRFLRNYFRGEPLAAPEGEEMDRRLWVKEMCDKFLTGTLHCLDSEARLAYIFRDVAGLAYGEIAGILNKQEQTVRQIINRSRKKLKNFLRDQCVLYNPQGQCKCRMKQWVRQINLPEEYLKIRESVLRINLYRETEKVLPGKNFWQGYF